MKIYNSFQAVQRSLAVSHSVRNTRINTAQSSGQHSKVNGQSPKPANNFDPGILVGGGLVGTGASRIGASDLETITGQNLTGG